MENQTKELAKFKPTEMRIAELETSYGNLALASVDDRKGYLLIKDARIEVKNTRIEVDKIRKALGEDARAWVNQVNEYARTITKRIEPLEEKLQAEEKKYEAEQERVKAEKERIEAEYLQNRVNQLLEQGMIVNPMGGYLLFGRGLDVMTIKTLPDADFLELLRSASEKKMELEQKAKEEAEAKRIEDERVAKELAELKRLREEKEFEETQNALQENIKKREAEAKAYADKKAREDAEEKARQEALKPDKEKAKGYIDALLAVAPPVITDDNIRKVLQNVQKSITNARLLI